MSGLTQQAKWDQFVESQLPTRQNERFKYADFTHLKKQLFKVSKRADLSDLDEKIKPYHIANCNRLVFINGFYEPSLSATEAITITIVKNSHVSQQQAFASINEQINDEVCEISVSAASTMPIHLLFVATGANEFVTNPRQHIKIGANAQLILLEEFVALTGSPYFFNGVTTIELAENAVLDHYKIQADNASAYHVASISVKQQRNSRASFTNFSCGGLFARDDIQVSLLESGADCKTGGFYRLSRDNQYIDHHVDILHTAPHSNSEMLYKGILDKKSRAVFNGRLVVEKDAQKIVAFQANHNLLLSDLAEIYSKPELEINADDVKCQHGATTGQLDQDALFYMQSRGIAKAEALTILLQGFADEIISRVKHAGFLQRVKERLRCAE